MDPGQSIITTSRTFSIPKGVKELQIFCVDSGSAGGIGGFSYVPENKMTRMWAGAGGNGGKCTTANINVKGMDTISVSVGFSSGESTIVGDKSLYENISTSISSGGAGASMLLNNAGYDIQQTGGGDGQSGTRAFGESTGTLYAGGGGGGSVYNDMNGVTDNGKGGTGGGGNGGGNSGEYSTGGGGGGANIIRRRDGYGYGYTHGDIGQGGSGIAIIRWGY